MKEAFHGQKEFEQKVKFIWDFIRKNPIITWDNYEIQRLDVWDPNHFSEFEEVWSFFFDTTKGFCVYKEGTRYVRVDIFEKQGNVTGFKVNSPSIMHTKLAINEAFKHISTLLAARSRALPHRHGGKRAHRVL